MADDLQRLMDHVEGEGPSPEFVATLRERIVAEEALAADADDAIDVEIDLFPHTGADELSIRRAGRPHGLQLLGAAAAVAVLIVVGMWALTSGDGDPESELDTIDDPTTTTEATETDEDETGSPLTAGNTYFDPGTYRIDTLGTTFTFTVEETRGLLLNENDIVLITALTSTSANDRTLAFRRTPLLPDPTTPTAAVDPEAGWPADDLSGWLDAAGDRVTASTPTSSTLGGREATFVELEIPCRGTSCAADLPMNTTDVPIFNEGSSYRMWLVEQGQEDPLLVLAAIDDDETAWFDEADKILATLEFGSTEPNPLRRPAAGAIELAVFDGIRVVVPEGVAVIEPFDGFARILPADSDFERPQQDAEQASDVELLTRPLDTDGAEVVTTDQLVTLLEDEAVDLTEVAPRDVGGLEARTFDVTSGGTPNIVLKARPADLVRSEFGWEPPGVGHLWAIEHPERGLLLVSAEYCVCLDGDALRTWTDELLDQLEFRAPRGDSPS